MTNLFDQPGKPFGYAWIEERTKIEDHLIRRSRYSARVNDMAFQARVTKIQERLHKYDKTFAERSRQWAEAQAKRAELERQDSEFSNEELSRLIELFTGANDPVTAGIAAKASAALAKRKPGNAQAL